MTILNLTFRYFQSQKYDFQTESYGFVKPEVWCPYRKLTVGHVYSNGILYLTNGLVSALELRCAEETGVEVILID